MFELKKALETNANKNCPKTLSRIVGYNVSSKVTDKCVACCCECNFSLLFLVFFPFRFVFLADFWLVLESEGLQSWTLVFRPTRRILMDLSTVKLESSSIKLKNASKLW